MLPAPCFVATAGRAFLHLAPRPPLRLTRARPFRLALRSCAGTPPPPADGARGEVDADAAFSAFDQFLEESGLLEEGLLDEARPATKKERRREAREREEEFRRKEFERRLDVLTALPDEIGVKMVEDNCPGCGCVLQSEDEGMPGFLPVEIREERARRIREEGKGGAKKEGGGGDEGSVGVSEAWDGAAGVGSSVGVVGTPSEVPGVSPQELEEMRAILEEEGLQVGGGDAEGDGGDGKLNGEDGKTETIVCQRCFRLNNYGSIEPELRVESPRKMLEKHAVAEGDGDVGSAGKGAKKSRRNVLTPATFRKNLERLQSRPAVIVYLVDVFDFHGTFLAGLRDLVGDRSPVILAVNKIDLLPKDYKPERVERWVRHEAAALGLGQVQAVHLVSSTRGTGVKALLADSLNLARKRRSDIYVVGAANVGKSSFINHVLSVRMNRADAGAKTRGARKGEKDKRKKKNALTTSVIPGTTLDVIRIPLDQRTSLYDTPGIIMTHQLTNSLDAQELRAVLPARSVERVSLRLGEGKALFLGGLARIEVLEGRPFFFTAFVSSDVKVHPGRVEAADEFTNAHVGALLTPPYTTERLEGLGEWTSKTFTAEGEGWKRACVDIVLSGLGWVSVTGAGSVKIRVWAPKGVGVFTRDALMPFEVRVSGASRYTGSRAINTREVNKATRKRKNRRLDAESADFF